MIKKCAIIFTVSIFIMCLPVTLSAETITLDYSFGGEGVKTFILDASAAFYINCWCTDSVTVNGVNRTNTYTSFDECGTYVIEYSSSFSYSYIEMKAIGYPCSGGGGDPTPDPTPDPSPDPTPDPDPVPTVVPTQVSGSGPVSEYGQLRVSGSHIVSTSNNNVQLKGFSSHGLQWFPYVTGGNGTIEHLVENFGIDVLRAAMYAYEWDLGRSQWAGYLGVHPNLYSDQVKPLIQDAINNEIYIIVDWHIHWNPSDPNNLHWTPDPYTNEAKAFFSMVAQEFGNYPNLIYEVINEPGHGIDWSQVKTHAYEVISAIRQHDPDNIILVPSPIWGQDPVTPSNDPLLDIVDADNDGNTSEKAPNVAYTIHFYAMSHNFRYSADQAMANGIALFATEWGVSNYTGDGYIDISEGGPADQWTDWMEANSISWTAWSFCNKGESSAILEPYSYDNIDNEARWPLNEIMNGYYMQSGPWDDPVIKEAGEWLRDRINNGVIPPTPEPTPPVNGNIIVRARGISGSESITLKVNDSAVATWTLTTTLQDYTAQGNGTIKVEFTNDDTDNRDVQVDYIIVDGITYQAEDQPINTGVYSGTCGGEYSEWLQCNGYIEFPVAEPTPGNVLEVELESLSYQSQFSPLTVTYDSAASGGQAIQWPDNGEAAFTAPSDTADGQVLITFNLSQTANVEFSIQVNFGTLGNNDSFFYKIDSGSWVDQNNVATNGYEVLTPTTFNNLGAGSHTLRILRREDGALLDKVILTASAGTIAY
jgi:hypothetical protein